VREREREGEGGREGEKDNFERSVKKMHVFLNFGGMRGDNPTKEM